MNTNVRIQVTASAAPEAPRSIPATCQAPIAAGGMMPVETMIRSGRNMRRRPMKSARSYLSALPNAFRMNTHAIERPDHNRCSPRPTSSKPFDL